LVVTTFRTGLMLFPLLFHSYYKDLVSTAAFTLKNGESRSPPLAPGQPGNPSIPIRFYYRIKELIFYIVGLPISAE
jgi:hypothetical protein